MRKGGADKAHHAGVCREQRDGPVREELFDCCSQVGDAVVVGAVCDDAVHGDALLPRGVGQRSGGALQRALLDVGDHHICGGWGRAKVQEEGQ